MIGTPSDMPKYADGNTYQTSQGNTSTSPRGFVHLAEHQGDLGFTIKLNDRGFLHFVVQIVTLTSTLTHTCEHRVTTVSLGDVVLQTLVQSMKRANADIRSTPE
jgi:hypothetical protein